MEAYVAEVIQFRLESDDMAMVLSRARASSDDEDSLASEANRLNEERRAVLDRRDALEGAMVSGELDPATFIRVSGKLDEQIVDLDNRLAVLYEREDRQLLDIPHGEYVRSWWEAVALESRRRLIDVLVELRVGPGAVGSKRFDPARVRITWKV